MNKNQPLPSIEEAAQIEDLSTYLDNQATILSELYVDPIEAKLISVERAIAEGKVASVIAILRELKPILDEALEEFEFIKEDYLEVKRALRALVGRIAKLVIRVIYARITSFWK